MKVIGFPLYTYTAVLFTFLFGAGVGSLASVKFLFLERGKVWVAFIGIVFAALSVILCELFVFDNLLEMRTVVRIASSVAITFPLAFFLECLSLWVYSRSKRNHKVPSRWRGD
jgi:hypothetical protein